MTTRTRRLVVRDGQAECPECGTRVTVSVPPRAYVQHVHGQELEEAATRTVCVCGQELEVTVGQLFRGAA